VKVRHLTAIAAGAATVLLASTAAIALPFSSGNTSADSLRSVASKIGLRIGTAVTPFELDNAAYRQITAISSRR
jgi:endo-1,4-beta-xylanase